MNSSCQNFVNSLVQLSSELQIVYDETMTDWQPEAPPLTTLFSALGYRIVEIFDDVDSETKQNMFCLIEKAMESGDVALTTSVATGLIETLISQAAKSEALWQRMAPLLGPSSLHHAHAWLKG